MQMPDTLDPVWWITAAAPPRGGTGEAGAAAPLRSAGRVENVENRRTDHWPRVEAASAGGLVWAMEGGIR